MTSNVTELTCYGITKTIKEWTEYRGIPGSTIRYRIAQKWSTPQVLGYEPPPVNIRHPNYRKPAEPETPIPKETLKHPIEKTIEARRAEGWTDEEIFNRYKDSFSLEEGFLKNR